MNKKTIAQTWHRQVVLLSMFWYFCALLWLNALSIESIDTPWQPMILVSRVKSYRKYNTPNQICLNSYTHVWFTVLYFCTPPPAWDILISLEKAGVITTMTEQHPNQYCIITCLSSTVSSLVLILLAIVKCLSWKYMWFTDWALSEYFFFL